MSNALETTRLSKRCGHTWALQDCTLALPAGRVAALVGPNGAGKTTLLQLSVGLLEPTAGEVQVFGVSPLRQPKEALPRLGFVAQDTPLYKSFRVAELLTLGHKLNPGFDDALALARRNFLRVLMGETAKHGLTVLLSSHIIGDLERVCDYLIILSDAHVQLSGDIDEIVRSHKRLIGPRTLTPAVARIHEVIEERHSERQTTLLVRINGHLFDQSWEMHDVTLEEIVLAYMGQLAHYQRMETLPGLGSMRDGMRFGESEDSIRKETLR